MADARASMTQTPRRPMSARGSTATATERPNTARGGSDEARVRVVVRVRPANATERAAPPNGSKVVARNKEVVLTTRKPREETKIYQFDQVFGGP